MHFAHEQYDASQIIPNDEDWITPKNELIAISSRTAAMEETWNIRSITILIH